VLDLKRTKKRWPIVTVSNLSKSRQSHRVCVDPL
jgi:hypothetical protein